MYAKLLHVSVSFKCNLPPGKQSTQKRSIYLPFHSVPKCLILHISQPAYMPYPKRRSQFNIGACTILHTRIWLLILSGNAYYSSTNQSTTRLAGTGRELYAHMARM